MPLGAVECPLAQRRKFGRTESPGEAGQHAVWLVEQFGRWPMLEHLATAHDDDRGVVDHRAEPMRDGEQRRLLELGAKERLDGLIGGAVEIRRGLVQHE